MKQSIFYILFFCFYIQTLTAQNSQSITITEAGKLSEMITNPETVVDLQISGLMDARDFFFLRENCPNLENLDIKNVKISAYDIYPENVVPKFALSRKANTENWLDLRLNSDKDNNLTPTDTLLDNRRLFLLDKETDWSEIELMASIPEGATISPDPSTIRFEELETLTFTVTSENGQKANYRYIITLDNWFTVIISGDSEIGMRSNDSNKTKAYVKKAIDIHKYSTYSYSTYNYITPKTELFIMAGDMDQDRGGQLSDFDNVFKQVTDAGIPMITIYGNHDWEPDYWGDDSKGYTLTGHSSNRRTLNVVDTCIERSKPLGISDVHVFTSQRSGQVNPFTFKFRNVRFYMGQNYWFQPPYSSGILSATFYAPDDEIINPLENYIKTTWKDDAAVWIQHYPFNCADKWWVHQNDAGKSQDSNKGAWQTASAKREKLKELIRMTKNPIFFAGHNHTEATHTHSHINGNFKEYITGYFPTGKAFMVLMKEGVGVMEVKSIQL